MPVHNCVFQIEPFQITGSGCLDFFRELEMSAELAYFADIQFDKEILLISVQELDVDRRSRLNQCLSCDVRGKPQPDILPNPPQKFAG
jgi:hypothetical protein